jgi:hypothetical protein
MYTVYSDYHLANTNSKSQLWEFEISTQFLGYQLNNRLFDDGETIAIHERSSSKWLFRSAFGTSDAISVGLGRA